MMNELSIEFQSIIPANIILTLAKGVGSFFALILEEGGELWLTKYTKDRSVIWHRLLGSFEQNIPLGTYALMEDEQALIHVIAPYNQVFSPHFNDLENTIAGNPERDNTIIMTLTSSGNVMRINKYPFLSQYRLVQINNDVWFLANEISKCNITIQIRNLTKNSFLSNIFTNNYIDLTNVFWKDDELFVLLLTDGSLTYREKTIKNNNISAFLLVIDTIEWQIRTWFRADSVLPLKIEGCSSLTDDCNLFVIFSSIVVTDHYFIASYTNSQEINIYHEQDLIKSVEFEHPTTLVFIKITVSDRSISYTSLPAGRAEVQDKTQMFQMAKDENIVFSTLVSDFVISDFLGVERALHSDNHFIFLRFTQDLEFKGHLVIGSGTSIPTTERGCSCGSDCTNKDSSGVHCSRILCRPMRLFPPGYTIQSQQGTCSGYAGLSCLTSYSGSVPGAGGTYTCTGGIVPCTTPQNFYTCFNNNTHCLARDGQDQPGDLYNTKYQGIALAQPQSLATVDSVTPAQQGSNFIVNEKSNILLSGRFIDTLIANGEAKEKLYQQKLFGYIVNLNYN